MNKELAEFKEVEKWLIGKAKETKKVYLIALNTYCKYRGLNPKQLIDEIEEDRKKPRRERGEVEFKLKEFHEWLLNEKDKMMGGWKPRKVGKKGLSPKRANMIVNTVRSFYKINGFPVLNLRLPKAPPLKKNHKLTLRAEHVKKLVDHSPTIRDKAIILMLFQSGMDISTLISLNYGDVARGLENDECPLAIHVVRKKAGIEYTTFIGRDAIDALKAYLNKRRQKQGDIKYDEPLFVKEREIKGDKRITRNAIDKMLKQVAVLSGVVSKEEMENADMNPCRPHALRGAFSTIMKLQGVNNEIVEYWMGHAIPYESAYMIPQEDELRKIYAEHEEALSINRATEQIKKLEQKFNGKMETYDEIINRQAAEIEKLRRELGERKSVADALLKEIKDKPEKRRQLAELLAELLREKAE